jgi:tetratricopeptide (TPR) repeat protein
LFPIDVRGINVVQQGRVKRDEKSAETLNEVRQLLSVGQTDESLALLKAYWLEHPDDGEAADLLADLMKETGRSELSERLSKLAKQLSSEDDSESESPEDEPGGESAQVQEPTLAKHALNAQELFEAGFSLIDARQHELAAMLLNRCATMVPEEPVVNYELGFALMSSKRFDEAISYFERAVTKSPDFDTFLNLTACYGMTRRLDDARRTIEKIEKLELDEEQSRELTHRKVVLRRLDTLSGKPQLSTRDWLYALYGAILLRPGVPQASQKEDVASIGSVLAILKGVLEGLRFELEAIEFFGVQSRPLAQALAELFEIPVSGYRGPDRAEKTLLTLTWANDIIGPHEAFLENTDQRSMFAYSLSWNEPLPVVPEIVGTLGFEDPMPWHELGAFSDDTDPITAQDFKMDIEEKYKAILSNARLQESDPSILHAVQEALDFYIGKEDLLVLANAKAFPRRSEYTAEVLG